MCVSEILCFALLNSVDYVVCIFYLNNFGVCCLLRLFVFFSVWLDILRFRLFCISYDCFGVRFVRALVVLR